MYQAMVLHLEIMFYVCAAETSILHIVMAQYMTEQLTIAFKVLSSACQPLIKYVD